ETALASSSAAPWLPLPARGGGLLRDGPALGSAQVPGSGLPALAGAESAEGSSGCTDGTADGLPVGRGFGGGRAGGFRDGTQRGLREIFTSWPLACSPRHSLKIRRGLDAVKGNRNEDSTRARSTRGSRPARAGPAA